MWIPWQPNENLHDYQEARLDAAMPVGVHVVLILALIKQFSLGCLVYSFILNFIGPSVHINRYLSSTLLHQENNLFFQVCWLMNNRVNIPKHMEMYTIRHNFTILSEKYVLQTIILNRLKISWEKQTKIKHFLEEKQVEAPKATIISGCCDPWSSISWWIINM